MLRAPRVLAVAVLIWAVAVPPAAAAAAVPGRVLEGWRWPVEPAQVAAGFQAPAHRYGAGHRGIDLVAPVGAVVHAPAAGVVAFAGSVAGRGVVTIDHGDSLVSTLEPIAAMVTIGEPVAGGAAVGIVTTGGHSEPGTVHFGVRENGEYINPLVLLGGVERAILLPCC